MWLLYDEMVRAPPALSGAPGREAADMRLALGTFRAWAKALNPPHNALDTLQQCSDFGRRAPVQAVLQRMQRDLELPRALAGERPSVARFLDATAAVRASAEAAKAKGRRGVSHRTDMDGDGGGGGGGGRAAGAPPRPKEGGRRRRVRHRGRGGRTPRSSGPAFRLPASRGHRQSAALILII